MDLVKRILEILLVCLTTMLILVDSNVEITVTEGKLVGFTKKLVDTSLTVDTFYRIPYAMPPVGQFRFKPPVPVVPWEGERSAKYLPNSCIQEDFLDEKSLLVHENLLSPPTKISEDCLYLNLWVPRNNNNKTLSTLVWFHGGNFAAGSASSSITDGAYLAAKFDIIVISVNYRLGVMGFFYTGTQAFDAKGNLGLLDQKMALQWIANNLETFGGDPNDVTLFGVDAGAASVGFHLLSPPSWPYFSRAVLQSGSPLSSWAMSSTDVMSRNSRELATLAGCNQLDGEILMACMREMRVADILKAQLEFSQMHKGSNHFVPVRDGDFMGDNPGTLLRAGKTKPAPILIGVNENDGVQTLISRLPQHFPANTSSTDVTRDVFIYDVIPTYLGTNSPVQLKTLEFLYTDLVPDNRPPNSYYHASEAFVSDVVFKCDVIDFAKGYYVENDVYLYSFRHRVSTQVLPPFTGAVHYGELDVLFGLPFRRSWQYTQGESILSNKMMELWTNFAKFGSPNPPGSSEVWPPYDNETQRHLVMNTETGLTIQTGLRRAQCSFLNELLPMMKTVLPTQHKCSLPSDGGKLGTSSTQQHADSDTATQHRGDRRPDSLGQSHAHCLQVTFSQLWIYTVLMPFVMQQGLSPC